MKLRKLAFGCTVFVAAALAASGISLAANSCSVSSATGPNFAGYDVLSSTDLKVNGSISYSCTGSASPTSITLDKGQNSSSFSTRNLKKAGGTDLLNYNLYFDAALTQIWGDGTSGTVVWSDSNRNDTHTVFGRVPAGQTNASGGNYSDTVSITVNF